MTLQQIPNPIQIVSGSDIAVSLADEGVPIRAIARAIRTPSTEVYEVLEDAIITGKLIEMPQSDWPPGSRGAARTSGPAVLQQPDELLRLAVGKVFGLTRLQATVFVAILRRLELTKAQLHFAASTTRPNDAEPTDPKLVDVVICHIRKRMKKLKLPILIQTLWGQGYSMSAGHRDVATAMLDVHFAQDLAA